MNGYLVILFDLIVIIALWLAGGPLAGIIGILYCAFMGIMTVQYNRGVIRIINMLKNENDTIKKQKDTK